MSVSQHDDTIFDIKNGFIMWKTPSKDSSGSMPIGNGDIGLNVWVEEDGDLFFYIGKTDSWSENGRLLKLGRVRVRLSPNPFTKGTPFLQTLKLRSGEIEIQAGKGNLKTTLKIWVDANQPVIRLEVSCEQNLGLQVILELWRNRERILKGDELDSAYGLINAPYPVVVHPDTVLPPRGNSIIWFHRNRTSIWPETMKLQGLESFMKQSSDPLLNRTFGGMIRGDGLVVENETTLKSAEPRKHYIISIYLLTAQTETPEEWIQQLEHQVKQVESKDLEEARVSHQKWWSDFWERSWIRVSGTDDAEVVSRGYILQRFINACAGRGAYPIKFNGSIFTVDEKERSYDADYRRWGGPYWFQNTRLIYWSMLKSGDFDMMQPLFRMYLNALPLAKERTKIYFGHDGAFFPETMYFWGAYANDNYGWNRKDKHVSYVENNYIRYYWQGGLELIAMMLDYYDYTQDDEFSRTILIPLADAIIQFYDKHYRRDDKGKIRFEPAQSLETWWKCVNPLPEIAGLTFVLNKLLSLPTHITTENQRITWKRLLKELPPIPTRKVNGKTILSPAEKILDPENKNIENPELYAVFPYRLYGVVKPNVEMARLTFFKRRFKGNRGWQQDDIHAAYLGFATEARRYVAERFANKHRDSRFPAFWGPNFDWIPDQDHGNVGLIALQAMLMQCDDEKIFLFPAWPKDWNVEFKLHAPMNTTVEGVYRNGKLEKLKVTPKERVKDIVVMKPQ